MKKTFHSLKAFISHPAFHAKVFILWLLYDKNKPVAFLTLVNNILQVQKV